MNVTSPTSSVLVIDANAAVYAVLPMLSGPQVDAVSHFDEWQEAKIDLAAPSLWLAECTSTIRGLVYSKAISAAGGRRALKDILTFEVETIPMDASLCQSALEWAARLKQRRAYDSFYLALAEALKTEFWTADKRLANGAQQIGVNWVRWIGES